MARAKQTKQPAPSAQAKQPFTGKPPPPKHVPSLAERTKQRADAKGYPKNW